jgi:hypothetical protein
MVTAAMAAMMEAMAAIMMTTMMVMKTAMTSTIMIWTVQLMKGTTRQTMMQTVHSPPRDALAVRAMTKPDRAPHLKSIPLFRHDASQAMCRAR